MNAAARTSQHSGSFYSISVSLNANLNLFFPISVVLYCYIRVACVYILYVLSVFFVVVFFTLAIRVRTRLG